MSSDFFLMQNLEPNFSSKIQPQTAKASSATGPGCKGCLQHSVSEDCKEFPSTLNQIAHHQKHNNATTDSNDKKAPSEGETNADRAFLTSGKLCQANLFGSNDQQVAGDAGFCSVDALKSSLLEETLNLLKAFMAHLQKINSGDASVAKNVDLHAVSTEVSTQTTLSAEISKFLMHPKFSGSPASPAALQGFFDSIKNLPTDGSLQHTSGPDSANRLRHLIAQLQALKSDGQAHSIEIKAATENPQLPIKGNLNQDLNALAQNPASANTQLPNSAQTAEKAAAAKAEEFIRHILLKPKPQSETTAKAANFFESIFNAKGVPPEKSLQNLLQAEAGQRAQLGAELKSALRVNLNPQAGANPDEAGHKPFNDQAAEKKAFAASNIKTVQTVADALVTEAGGAKGILADGGNKNLGQPINTAAVEEPPSENQTRVKAAEFVHKHLPSQALNQIVQKAALHLNNGQNELRIDLKPEFLGQLRMHIITDSHQVTVKIIAESHFVKDMIENNFNQLKQDLQNHGLKVDDLEVSVANDAGQRQADNQRLSRARIQNQANRSQQDDQDKEQLETSTSNGAADADENSIDLRV
jgi:flagellar hook-length control protein FliK